MNESEKDNNVITMDKSELKRSIEALLFVTEKPLTVSQIKDVTGHEAKAILEAIESISDECDRGKKGFRLKALAGGYHFVTDPDVAETVKNYVKMKEKKRISQASLETLSIIAYRQPVTRAEIEFVRGVNVDGGLKTLLEKGLIRVAGRKEVAGRPILYSTTNDFLDHFGLSQIKELPKLAEFTEKDIELPDSMRAPENIETVVESKEDHESQPSKN